MRLKSLYQPSSPLERCAFMIYNLCSAIVYHIYTCNSIYEYWYNYWLVVNIADY